ncbi:MAG: hypothetical protein FRC53_03420 [Pseudoramibacter sp. EUB1.1]|uniref:Uncharacterized protein n=1 Tax=Candidatus Pseudoramibacter fermentans TaxID=2594427 RepID=A0A6L5GQD8_9FIRM|nr:hypothetical protein [Candidatus Pseudoramibacter fermentans]
MKRNGQQQAVEQTKGKKGKKKKVLLIVGIVFVAMIIIGMISNSVDPAPPSVKSDDLAGCWKATINGNTVYADFNDTKEKGNEDGSYKQLVTILVMKDGQLLKYEEAGYDIGDKNNDTDTMDEISSSFLVEGTELVKKGKFTEFSDKAFTFKTGKKTYHFKRLSKKSSEYKTTVTNVYKTIFTEQEIQAMQS